MEHHWFEVGNFSGNRGNNGKFCDHSLLQSLLILCISASNIFKKIRFFEVRSPSWRETGHGWVVNV